MNNRENEKWLDKILSKTIGSEKIEPDFEHWKKEHPQAVETLTSGASDTSVSKRLINIKEIIMKNPITKFAAAAVIIIILVVGLSRLGGSVESVAWADVAERFESVPFIHQTTYVSWGPYDEDQEMETHKIETWRSENGQIRTHSGNEVVFADYVDGNNVVVGFDRSTKQPLNADRMAKLKKSRGGFVHAGEIEFSFDNLIGRSSEDKEIISVQTADTAASKEIVLFEVKRKTAPSLQSWIWALHKSKLPIRASFRDTTNKIYADFIFDYSEKKDAKFFDPNAFTNQQEDAEQIQ